LRDADEWLGGAKKLERKDRGKVLFHETGQNEAVFRGRSPILRSAAAHQS